ncbi:MAG: hypothetical protein BMS9Abin17_1029 [Acidimicrobiia bacterium]|nr:MAG: hypothetical protein BMS9Abin17_1029 [Acidimicrobiia bacterium]
MPKDPYGRIAPWYDRFLEPLNAPVRAISMKMLQPSDGMMILDVGCGTGTGLERYLDAGCEVFGIDASQAMLDQAHNRLGDRADLTLGNAADMPYDDNTFDVVVASMFLHELPVETRDRVVSEIARVLAPDGKAVFIDFAASDLTPKGRAIRAMSMVVERIAGRDHHRNCKTFLSSGGVPTLSSPLDVDRSKILGGGNMGIYVLAAASGSD